MAAHAGADDLAAADATDQAGLVRRGELSPSELVDGAIARIEKLDPAVNAVIHPSFDKARRAAAGPLADGPFRGVPLLLKDLTAHSAGDPFHEGMQMLKDLHWREDDDTYLVRRFRQAGFVIVGRTNTPEMGLLPTTEPAAYGPSRNPWDLTRSTGGSSGGSAAAVACGMVPVAHASDGGGSIRIPASECGLVGLKPTRGRTSLGPEYGEVWAGLVAEHVVTRSVRDSAAVLDAVAGPMTGDPYFAPAPVRAYSSEVGRDPGRLRVGVLQRDPTGTTEVHPECVSAARAGADALAELGHDVSECHPRGLEDPQITPNLVAVFAAYAEWCLEDTRRRTGRAVDAAGCEPATWAIAELSRASTPAHYIAAVQFLHVYARRVRAWWEDEGFDLLLTPTIPEPPLPLGQFAWQPENPLGPLVRAAAVVPFTIPYNVTGQPALSLPLHWSSDELPIGVQLVAAYGREDVLVRIAAQLEEHRPWSERRPPHFAELGHGAGAGAR